MRLRRSSLVLSSSAQSKLKRLENTIPKAGRVKKERANSNRRLENLMTPARASDPFRNTVNTFTPHVLKEKVWEQNITALSA